MEYITAEQFKSQPAEVQKILKEWVQDKYTKGDLVATEHGGIETVIIFDKFKDENQREGYYCISEHNKQPMWLAEYKEWLTPLFGEEQLRKFIEDKTKCKADIVYINNKEFQFSLWEYPKYEKNKFFFSKNIIASDLLLAYWQVACEIAKEVCNE